VTMSGSVTKRCQSLKLPTGESFEWRYARTKGHNCKKEERLLLVQEPPADSEIAEKIRTDVNASKQRGGRLTRSKNLFRPTVKPQPRILAQLIRNDEMRSPGTSKCTTGNGGQLILDPTCGDLLPEELVMSSCLVMLRREQDRLRCAQAAIIVAIVL